MNAAPNAFFPIPTFANQWTQTDKDDADSELAPNVRNNPNPVVQQALLVPSLVQVRVASINFVDRMAAESRQKFILKVYGILTAQLVLTFGIIFIMIRSDAVRRVYESNVGLFWNFSIAITLTIMCCFACVPNMARATPINYVFLSIFTVCEAFVLAPIAFVYDPVVIYSAFGVCIAVFAVLSVVAWSEKFDLTAKGAPYLLGSLSALVVSGVILLFIRNEVAHVVYSIIGAILFCIYIIYDTQLILGGKHRFSFRTDDHVFASLSLYLDVINLFLYTINILDASYQR